MICANFSCFFCDYSQYIKERFFKLSIINYQLSCQHRHNQAPTPCVSFHAAILTLKKTLLALLPLSQRWAAHPLFYADVHILVSVEHSFYQQALRVAAVEYLAFRTVEAYQYAALRVGGGVAAVYAHASKLRHIVQQRQQPPKAW